MKKSILAFLITWPLWIFTFHVFGGETPKFVSTNYIELDKIAKVSRFRSCIGHDFSQGSDGEYCRSMKHYFFPKDLDWSSISLSSPVHGTVSELRPGWAGTAVTIRCTQYPKYHFLIFHVDIGQPLSVGQTVEEGQLLGKHIGIQTYSDIAVNVITQNGPYEEWQFISYFEVMTDSLLSHYQPRGVITLDDIVISRVDRDADPCTCTYDGSYFTAPGTLQNWVILSSDAIRPTPASWLFLLLD